MAHRLVIGTTLFWIVHEILYIVYFVHVKPSSTNTTSFTIIDYDFSEYRNYISILTVLGFFSVGTAVLFELLAYRNIRQLAHRTVPVVRCELDKQLTIMMLAQVVMNVPTYLLYNTFNSFSVYTFMANYQVIQPTISVCHHYDAYCLLSLFAINFEYYIEELI